MKISENEVYSRLNKVFREFFDDENIVLDEETNQENIEGWDSLAHISLMFAIEQEFKIKFDMDEVIRIKKIGEIVDIILSK